MFPNIHKHIPVTSLEGGRAQEVKLSLFGITDIGENDSLANQKSRPPPLDPGTYLGSFVNVFRLRKIIVNTGLEREIGGG